MSLVKTLALLQLLTIMNNVSVQAVTLRIQGGSTVHVGDRVNITCTCDFINCFQGVHFRISGVHHNYSILEGGGVTNYNLEYTTDWNTLTVNYTLVLVNATVNDNGTTYQCIPYVLEEEEAEWSNTETLTVLTTEGPSPIEISLDPQPALIGEDVQIRCTLSVQIPVLPRIAVNDKEETLQSLANKKKYTLTSSTNTNGVAVYVLTLHNVSVSDNGTRFECFVRSYERRITSGTRVLKVGYKVILMTTTTTTTTTTTKGNFATPITKPTATPVQPKPTATGGPSQISISLDPQPALIGEDVQIRCTHNISRVINYYPWIVVDGETTTLNTLTSQEKYSLNQSVLINGQAVYVVIMHNVSASDNGTRFEFYFALNGGEEIRSGTVALRVRHKATKQPSPIEISLDPQPTLIGEDVQIRCTLVQIPVLPRIAVNDKEETLQSLANTEKYTLTNSITNGVAVYVLTLHNVSVSDNGTRFECFVRSSGGKQTSATVTLNIRYKSGPGTITAAPTTVEGSLYTTDCSGVVSTHVQTLEQSTFCVSPTILVAPKTSTVELYAILIPVGVLVALLVISLLIIMIMALVLVKRRQHEQDINGEGIGEILEERKENIYVM